MNSLVETLQRIANPRTLAQGFESSNTNTSPMRAATRNNPEPLKEKAMVREVNGGYQV
jgi:hypothetical protein